MMQKRSSVLDKIQKVRFWTMAHVYISSPYTGVVVNLLTNSCLFTHPADTKKHMLSFGVTWIVVSPIFTLF